MGPLCKPPVQGRSDADFPSLKWMGLATFYLLNRWEMPRIRAVDQHLAGIAALEQSDKGLRHAGQPLADGLLGLEVPASKAGMASARNAP